MLLEFTLIFALGCYLGSKVTAVWNRITFREILKDLVVTDKQMRDLAEKNGIIVSDDDTNETPKLVEMEIRIEKHGDILYAFRKDNDQFLGQGADRDALIARLNQTMRPCIVNVSKEDGADLIAKPVDN